MKMNKLMTGAFALTVATSATLPAFADGETPPPPVVSGVTMTQAFDRKVTINYTLADGPAVITLDVQTNATPNAAADDPGWTSIGGEAIWNAAGDVWKKVEGDTTHTITWRPDQSWPGHKITGNGARAVVTAWATNNTPDYMVVHLDVEGVLPNFYPAVEFLPKSGFKQEGAAITNNPAYKTTKLVMRKIEAAGIPWTMGSSTDELGHTTSDARETPHLVTLTSNYYMGVFEVTQEQWKRVMAANRTPSYFTVNREMRPVEQVFHAIRCNSSETANATYDWPSDPNPASFLGRLRARVDNVIALDLPSEAQWEYAARAGHGDGKRGDGSAIIGTTTDANMALFGRYVHNDAKGKGNSTPSTADVDCGSAIVGSYRANSWGLYDTCGNVYEICLDWYEINIATSTDATGEPYNGRLNIDPSMPTKTLSGTVSTSRVRRGGSFGNTATQTRPAYRGPTGVGYRDTGFRVACPVGIQ